MTPRRKVGIVGYGNLGRYLYQQIKNSDNFETAFVWNRTPSALDDVEDGLVLRELSDFPSKSADIIVEVAHPDVTRKYGAHFVRNSDFFIGSPTILAENEVEISLRESAIVHGVYIPSGALWGGEDILRLVEAKSLEFLKITMTKHPKSFKLIGELKEKNERVHNELVVLYEGPVRDICRLAPNNTNTMATAAIAASNLGMDGVIGCLVADPDLPDYHIVEVEALGPVMEDGRRFTVHTVRKNPASIGAVTGVATYAAFFASLKRAVGKGAGFHLC